MRTFEPKSKPFWFTFTITFSLMVLILAVGIFLISQLTFSNNMDDLVTIQTDAVNEQIVYNFEVYTSDIINTSNNLQAILNNTDIVNDKTNTELLLSNIGLLDKKYNKISIYDLDGINIASSDSIYENINNLDVSWFKESQLDQTTHYFSRPIININQDYQIVISKYISTNKYKDNAVIKMEIDFSSMIDLVLKSNLGNNGHISIINNDYEYIYTSDEYLDKNSKSELEIFKDLILGSRIITQSNEKMMFIISTISNTPWRIGTVINVNESYIVRQNFVYSILLFSLIFIILASFVFYGVSKTITRPLNKLVTAMTQIDFNEEFEVEAVEINYPKEVEVLNHNFNEMMKRINQLMVRVIMEQEGQRKSELKALQNQINPHFLYNTLDSIVYMVENNKNEEASEMLLALSKLFKISISGGNNIIPIVNELEHAKNYLLIQKIRYKDKFSYELIIEDESVLKMDTMKLILQPLIENALYHGITKLNHNGKITIIVGLEDGLIKFSVSDNGYGMTLEKIDELYEKLNNDDLSDGVGLKNIYQRIKVYYGAKASIKIDSKADEGTIITILLPAGEIV